MDECILNGKSSSCSHVYVWVGGGGGGGGGGAIVCIVILLGCNDALRGCGLSNWSAASGPSC